MGYPGVSCFSVWMTSSLPHSQACLKDHPAPRTRCPFKVELTIRSTFRSFLVAHYSLQRQHLDACVFFLISVYLLYKAIFLTFLTKYIMYFTHICSSPSLVTRFAGLSSQIRQCVYLFVCVGVSVHVYVSACVHACVVCACKNLDSTYEQKHMCLSGPGFFHLSR